MYVTKIQKLLRCIEKLNHENYVYALGIHFTYESFLVYRNL